MMYLYAYIYICIMYYVYMYFIFRYFDLGLPTQRHCRVWLCRCCCRLGRGDHRLHRPCCHSWRSCLASKAKSVCVKVLGFKVKKWFNEFKYIVKSIEKSFQWDFSWFFMIFLYLLHVDTLITLDTCKTIQYWHQDICNTNKNLQTTKQVAWLSKLWAAASLVVR